MLSYVSLLWVVFKYLSGLSMMSNALKYSSHSAIVEPVWCTKSLSQSENRIIIETSLLGTFPYILLIQLLNKHGFLMLSRLFIAALWSPTGKGLAFWLLLVMFIVFLLLSHVISWVRCGTWLYHFLIFAVFLSLSILYLKGSEVEMFKFQYILKRKSFATLTKMLFPSFWAKYFTPRYCD